MGSQKEGFGVTPGASPESKEIESRILAHLQTGITHPKANEFVRAAHGRRCERARETPRLFANRAELVTPTHQLPR
jgi:hypothetical protein